MEILLSPFSSKCAGVNNLPFLHRVHTFWFSVTNSYHFYDIQVSIMKQIMNFLIYFYEFRNPLGLQCGEYESGGLPCSLL